jgi:hypothetical protein
VDRMTKFIGLAGFKLYGLSADGTNDRWRNWICHDPVSLR